MSTQNVKILLRRGFRDEITSAALETGEMGFTTDTNQLFVGTDKTLNSIQFDPFANAHAVIQSWLDGPDNPYPGLTVNEDLTIDLLNSEDIDVLLDAMRFYEQVVTLTDTGSVAFTVGETLYQYWNDVTQDPPIVKQRRLGEILEVTDSGDNTELRLKVAEQAIYGWRYEHSETTDTFSEEIINGTADDNNGGVGMLTIGVRDYGLEQVDELHVPTSITYYNGVDDANTLTYNDDDTLTDYTYEFESADNPDNSRFIITFRDLVLDGKRLVLSTPTYTDTFDGSIIPHTPDTFVINPNYHIDTGDIPATRYVVRVDGSLQTETVDYTVNPTNFAFTVLPDPQSVVTIAYEIDEILNEDGEVSFDVTFDDSSNFWLSTDRNYTKLDTNIKVQEVSGISEFRGAFFGRERRNVEVITENSFNQLFADQHLSSLDSATGLRSSLLKKTLIGEIDENDPNVLTGTFLKYHRDVCTSFFVDYSLKQYDGNVTYIRVGQLKIVNGYPLGVAQAKLTDDNTEIWQDDSDGVAEVDEFSNIEFDTNFKTKQVLNSKAYVGVEANIISDTIIINGITMPTGVSLQEIKDTINNTVPDINAEVFEYDVASGQHSILSLWSHDKVADFVPIDTTGTEPGIFPNTIHTTNTIDIDFTQDENFTTEISYTVKRWSM